MGGLSEAQLFQYRERGYVVVPHVLEPGEIERYRERARKIVHGDHPPEAANRLVKDIRFAKGELPLPEDPEHALWKIMNPDRFDSVMAECLALPRVLDAVESVIGPDLLAFLLMFIYKPPGLADAINPFHQDGVYFPFGPHDQVCGVWIALDPIDESNGGLCVVPGSHRDDVQPHEALPGVNAGAFAAPAEKSPEAHDKSVTFSLEPGEAVIFHPRLYHRTGGNTTKRHRRVVTLHIASARCTSQRESFSEYGFQLVRGRTYEGCLQPPESRSLRLHR